MFRLTGVRYCAAIAAAVAFAITATAAAGQSNDVGSTGANDDPELRQRLDADQRVAVGRSVLKRGHIDVGPRFTDGKWTLMIHDDTRKQLGGKSVWRHAERTVMRVSDETLLRVPADRTYSFLSARPGDRVYVIPETQNRAAVWLGWNTQDPAVRARIDRGVTMTTTAVQGPGDLIVYLQSGNFKEPQILWDSRSKPRSIWVDVGTHSHANWIFTKPGVYLVEIKVDAELIDGQKVSDRRQLRFAVGSATDPGAALAARLKATADGGDGGERKPAAAAAEVAEDEGSTSAIVAILVAAAALLAAGLIVVIWRGARAKRRAGLRPDASKERRP